MLELASACNCRAPAPIPPRDATDAHEAPSDATVYRYFLERPHRCESRRRTRPIESDRRRRMRLRLLNADPHCWYCGRGLCLACSTLDHLWPRSRRGGNNLKNIRLACDGCNAAKANVLISEIAVIARRGAGVVVLSNL